MHLPVLQKEVIKNLDPKENQNFIDCTVGTGGHSLAILEKILPKGKVLGIDKDEKMIKNLKEKKIKNLILVNSNFSKLKEIILEKKFGPIQGILLDLGMSSWHLEESGRGFSFQKNEPLDMRYDEKESLTAERILNYWSKTEIEKILKEYGEDPFAEKISEEIINFRRIRPIKKTHQLVEIIERAVPQKFQHKKIHPATKTFQALRIAVNDELKNIEETLPQALKILAPGGKLAVISFHSLEDRIVKNFFKEKFKKGQIKLLTKKPITPTKEEIKINPRSRSAKLRAAEKILIQQL